MEFIILSIFTLLTGGFVSMLVKNEYKMKVCALASFISTLLALKPLWMVLYKGIPLEAFFKGSSLFGFVNLVLDPLSAFFYLVISVMSLFGIIYANGYLKSLVQKGVNLSSHSFFLMMLIAAMLGVTIVQNSLFFLVAWELMSLASFFLVIFEGDKKEVLSAGVKYLIYMHLSVLFLIAMFAILINGADAMDFALYKDFLANNPQIANWIFILGFIGFGIKAGFVPFHNWLPDAHPAAPSHISGIMSGVMIKTGIYGILRVLSMIGVPSKMLCYMTLTVAVVTIFYGVLYAISQKNIKRLLAYSSIENIGIIGVGMGIGMFGLAYNNPIVAALGFAGGILHILNHSIFKELLFFTFGSVYQKTHTKNIEQMGGLIKKMPVTGMLFIIGSIAICGLPPFNGFIGEILIYAGMLMGVPTSETCLFIILIMAIAAMALIGTMSLLCFTKASGIIFLGEARSEKAQNVEGEVCVNMLIPTSVLAMLTLVIGVYPEYFVRAVLCPASFISGGVIDVAIVDNVVSLTQVISRVFLVLLGLILVCLFVKAIFAKNSRIYSTWGCGYDKPNSRIQYTASSYANLFVSTLKPLFKRVSHIKKPKDLFPKEAYYEMEIEDIEEAYIVKPLVRWDEKMLSKFEKIQNGNIQQYILFGLIFLVLSIIGLVCIG